MYNCQQEQTQTQQNVTFLSMLCW